MWNNTSFNVSNCTLFSVQNCSKMIQIMSAVSDSNLTKNAYPDPKHCFKQQNDWFHWFTVYLYAIFKGMVGGILKVQGSASRCQGTCRMPIILPVLFKGHYNEFS